MAKVKYYVKKTERRLKIHMNYPTLAKIKKENENNPTLAVIKRK